MRDYPESVILEEVRCPLHEDAAVEEVIAAKDVIYDVPGRFFIVRCATCGLLFTSPRPTLDTVGAYYPSEYKPFSNASLLESRSLTAPSRWRRRLSSIVQTYTTALPALAPGSMLEIGCATGRFLSQMHSQGWTVAGIEPDSRAAATARAAGLSVYTGSLESAPDRPQQYDLVVGWMVLEHLHDPIRSLRKLHSWTKPGGWLALSVPNAASLERRLFGRYWYALQVPTHTFHYTPHTLSRVLSAGGWALQRVLHQRVLTNLVASTGIWLRAHGFGGGLTRSLIHFSEVRWSFQRALYPLAFLLSFLGQTGRMTVWARRADD